MSQIDLGTLCRWHTVYIFCQNGISARHGPGIVIRCDKWALYSISELNLTPGVHGPFMSAVK